MPQDAEVLLSLAVQCNERAPAAVRRELSRVSGMNGVLPDLLLIASEIVTNAVLHSDCPEPSELDVTLTRTGGEYILSVEDPGLSEGVARVAESRSPGSGGLGLRIVEELAFSWGQERREGYRVWATLAAGSPSLASVREGPDCG
jgi:signal transduction histidine kinase